MQQVQAKFDQGNATLQEIEQARLDESDKWLAFLDADFAREQAQLNLLAGHGPVSQGFSIRCIEKALAFDGLGNAVECFERP